MPDVYSNLGKLRQIRGLSAVQLAAMVEVSRQTIYAIEAGTYVPNTTVALKLARALDTTVEDLFGLSTHEPVPYFRAETALLLPGAEAPQPGQPVQLCRVDDRLVANAPSPQPWYFPAADAVVSDKRLRRGLAEVRVFQSGENFTSRILVAGCDPGISVLARHVLSAGIELVLAHRNSSQALKLLEEGRIHVAGTHLKNGIGNENSFANSPVAVISFAVWEEGIVTARGNPKNVRAIEDFARKDICVVNRELGAGCRALLDSHLRRSGIDPEKVRGYDHLAAGHLAVSWTVQSGAVDCGIATRAAARLFGLGFIPLVSERYDLVVHKKHLDVPAIQNLLDTLSRSSFRRELEGLGGYDTRTAGQLKE
jgi:putative molybdopterin biosynthesis protein